MANLMFALPAVEWSTRDRSSADLVLAEVVATLGLLLVIVLTVRRGHLAPIPFAAHIGGADDFTSSTSFANPAVSIARTTSDTFAGIEPASAPLFVAAQLVAVGVAVPLIRFLAPSTPVAEST